MCGVIKRPSLGSVGVIHGCRSFFGLQEFETDKEVPERMGATAAGENEQGPLGQVAGRH